MFLPIGSFQTYIGDGKGCIWTVLPRDILMMACSLPHYVITSRKTEAPLLSAMSRPDLLGAYHLANAHILKALIILGTMGRDTYTICRIHYFGDPCQVR